MPTQYAQPADCIDVVPSLSVIHEESVQAEAALMQSLLDASRVFETDVFAPVDYFAKSPEEYTTRNFYSNGTQFIRLNPYTSIRYIRDNENNTIDTSSYELFTSDIYQPTGYYLKWLYRDTCGCSHSWFHHRKITVSARWGFKCIPPDVVVAVKSLGCIMFLADPLNRQGLNSGLSDDQQARLRNTYNRIVNAWQNKFYHQELGI